MTVASRNTERKVALEIANSPIHGKGVFVVGAGLAANQRIGDFAGKRTDTNGRHVLWVDAGEQGWRGYDGTNALRFLNHCAEPNAYFDGLVLFAVSAIAVGEELTIDYGYPP